MSLKSNLSSGPLKNFMTNNFGKLKPFIRDWDTREPAIWKTDELFPYLKSEKYFLLGTAYDIYVRTTLARKTQDKKFLEGLFVFLEHMASDYDYYIFYDVDWEFVDSFKKDFYDMAESNKDIDLNLIIDLAVYEDMVRGASRNKYEYVFPTDSQREELSTELTKFVELSSGKLFNYLQNSSVAHGKTFGEYSVMLGGADLDLITKDSIIDMKTIKELKFDSKDWFQVLSYSLLNNLSDSNHQVDKIFIYYARFDKLLYIDLRELNASSYLDEFDITIRSL